MNPLYWYIDALRDAVNAPHTVDADALREPAAAYNDACREANRRLREAGRLLRDGLRNEAVQTAEQEPKLLELVGELDFPGAEDWLGMAAQWGIDLPPELELGVAAEINTAYAELMPLDQLLQTHRKLALARAPLAYRITVLRKIADADPLTDAWKTDLEAYERVRIRQVREEFRRAQAAGDLEALERLLAELKRPDWLVDTPAELLQEAEAATKKLGALMAREGLAELLPLLDAAYSQFDLDGLASLAKKWNSLAAAAGLGADDPLDSQSRPALDWLHEEQQAIAKQQQFAAAVAKLEDALDSHVPREKLETLLHKAERFELSIPEVLQHRVLQRLETQGIQSRRRGWLVGGAAGLLAVAAAAVSFIYWQNVQTQQLLDDHTARLAALADEDQWPAVVDYVAKLPAELRESPKLAVFASRADAALQAETNRAHEAESLLARLEAISPTEVPPDLMQRLRELERLPDEKARRQTIELAIRRASTERQAELDRAFLATLDAWSEKIEGLTRKSDFDDIDLFSMLTELDGELQQHPGVSSELRKRGLPLLNKLRALIAQQDSVAAERKILRQLGGAVGQPERYLALLEKLTTTSGESPAGVHARRLVEQKDAWMSIIAWIGFWDEHTPGWSRLEGAMAESLLRESETLTAESLPNPLSAALTEREGYLKDLSGRTSANVTQLKGRLIQDKLIFNTWMVVDRDRQRYYCAEKPVVDNSKVSFDYFKDYASMAHTEIFIDNVAYHGESPQSRCANALSSIFSQWTPATWDQTFYRLATAVRDAAQPKSGQPLDSVLAVEMLKRILETGTKGSWLFHMAFRDTFAELDNSGVDLTVYWFAPKNADADAARQDAAALIASLPDFAAEYRRARDRFGDVCLPPETRYAWVASLQQDATGGWVCEPALDGSATGDLVMAEPAGKGVGLSKAASVAEGQVEWESGAETSSWPHGAPLFLSIPKSTAP